MTAKLGNNRCRKFWYGRTHRDHGCTDNELVNAKRNGNTPRSGHNEIPGSNQKSKTDNAQKNGTPPSLFPENFLRSVSLFTRFNDRSNKPSEKHAQHQQAIESGKYAIKQKGACDYRNQQCNRKISFH